MASSSFSINLDEVDNAAAMIRRMHDDLEEAYIKLSTYVGTVKDDIYGTDLVGKSLGGATASVIGLAEQQKKALEAVKAFLENTAQVAANLKLMCGNHRGNDAEHSGLLAGLAAGPAVPLRSLPEAGSGYVPATPPPLGHNHADDRPEPPRPSPGAGHPNLM
ncbi:hypothetical protein [Kitasatospora sp. NPDC051914]|uniref:hypothetical protein n=1 Tax=Kitasatospora sp. NPDC051914 TaxID=3154945 RepID=UPI0034122822